MRKLWSSGRFVFAAMAVLGAAAILCLTVHKIGLATLMGMGVIVGVYRLANLADAKMSPAERQRREERRKLLTDNGPTGAWKELLGPTVYKALMIASVAFLVCYMLFVDLVAK